MPPRVLGRSWVEDGEGTALVTARNTRWEPLYSVDGGHGGYVEIAGYDGVYEVRIRGHVDSASGKDKNTPFELPKDKRRIGPGGSCTWYKVPEGGFTIEARCVTPFTAAAHVDPETGLFETSTRVAMLTARWLENEPDERCEQLYSWVSTNGDASSVPAVADAPNNITTRLFPTRYNRRFSFECVGPSPSGRLHKRSCYATGLGAGNAFDAITYTETLGPSGSGDIAPWQSLLIENLGASVLPAAIRMFPLER
jgi:hypothetical protein